MCHLTRTIIALRRTYNYSGTFSFRSPYFISIFSLLQIFFSTQFFDDRSSLVPASFFSILFFFILQFQPSNFLFFLIDFIGFYFGETRRFPRRNSFAEETFAPGERAKIRDRCVEQSASRRPRRADIFPAAHFSPLLSRVLLTYCPHHPASPVAKPQLVCFWIHQRLSADPSQKPSSESLKPVGGRWRLRLDSPLPSRSKINSLLPSPRASVVSLPSRIFVVASRRVAS